MKFAGLRPSTGWATCPPSSPKASTNSPSTSSPPSASTASASPGPRNKQPLHLITSLGFNCVRLTWATYLWTDDRSYETLTVEMSLKSLGLDETLRGVERNNRAMVGLRVREVYERVVRGLGEARVNGGAGQSPIECAGEFLYQQKNSSEVIMQASMLPRNE
ncbi:uncharacterized protein A4U43_C08F29770 [Asparagus officinalis]|nr:uncharacterized protein A4U43_C08F29770 [Asparagus officinalis]